MSERLGLGAVSRPAARTSAAPRLLRGIGPRNSESIRAARVRSLLTTTPMSAVGPDQSRFRQGLPRSGDTWRRSSRNEKVRGSNPLSSTKPAGQRPCPDPEIRSRQWQLSTNSDLCDVTGRMLTAGARDDHETLGAGVLRPLHGGDDHHTDHDPRRPTTCSISRRPVTGCPDCRLHRPDRRRGRRRAYRVHPQGLRLHLGPVGPLVRRPRPVPASG